MRATGARAFTLLEILITVIILGVLAALVVPQFSRAVSESAETATFDQLLKIRRALSYYFATNANQYPVIAPGNGDWGPLLPSYMRTSPENSWVPPAVKRVIVLGNVPDAAFQTNYGWIYDSTTGMVWAGSFDANDQPIPRP